MRMKHALPAACAALAATLSATPVEAAGSCSGSYSASLLQPLPAPLVVGLVVRDDLPRNLDLAAQFNAGLQQAGIVVTGTPTAQLTLHATFSGNGPDDAAREANPDTSASWWNGGVTQQYAPSSQFGGDGSAPAAATLQLRAELRPSPADPVAWVATLQCTLQGSDERRLAYDIGTVIGGAIGRRVDAQSF